VVPSALLSSIDTATALERQRECLAEEGQKKQDAVARLREIEACAAFEAGRVQHATQKTQAILTKPVFQASLQHRLQPSSPQKPAEQLKELMDITEKVGQGKVNPAMDVSIDRLNKEVGNTESLAERLEQESAQLDVAIEGLQQQIAARRENIALLAKFTHQISSP
jgi:chromosome segregation ATPase